MSDWEEVQAGLRRHGYRLGRLLGKGHFASVYLVEDREGERFACKVSDNAELLWKEARCLELPDHPLFPKYETFWQEDKGYLVMEYVPGRTLEELRMCRGGFSASAVARIGGELASGLGCLHERCGMLYRDVKPANIILCENGRIKLVDFGCVCPLGERPGQMAGTPGFAAPEQLQAEERLTERCDVYGLGRTLESLLGAGGIRRRAGRGVWKGVGRRGLPDIRKRAERGSLTGRSRLLRVLAACTREAPQERLPDMQSVALALAGAEKGFRTGRGSWEAGLLKGSLQVGRNIWKTGCKRT